MLHTARIATRRRTASHGGAHGGLHTAHSATRRRTAVHTARVAPHGAARRCTRRMVPHGAARRFTRRHTAGRVKFFPRPIILSSKDDIILFLRNEFRPVLVLDDNIIVQGR
eukprot:gene11771-biopygen1761